MGRIKLKSLKFLNLVNSHISSHFNSTPAFIRILPTDKCNLKCEYCWQFDNESSEMTFDEFKKYLVKASKLKVGMLTFLGGEPMLWDPLYEAISECSNYHILTDLTTNGTLLTAETIDLLGKAGLDYLNISVDGFKKSSVTKKNSVIQNDLIDSLKKAKAKFRMHFRINSVIFNNNFDDVKELIEFSRLHNVQISLGFIVPPTDGSGKTAQSIYFTKQDTSLLKEIVDYILHKKRSGYPIIDPDAYFENIFRFMNREKFWDCNYPTRYGWINVTPNGKIRSCTKKMDELDYNFDDLNRENLKEIRQILKSKVDECNIDCYSNCAYDSYFYTQHKLQMLNKVLSRLKH